MLLQGHLERERQGIRERPTPREWQRDGFSIPMSSHQHPNGQALPELLVGPVRKQSSLEMREARSRENAGRGLWLLPAGPWAPRPLGPTDQRGFGRAVRSWLQGRVGL